MLENSLFIWCIPGLYTTYINNDCKLAEAPQKIVPDSCRKIQYLYLGQNSSFDRDRKYSV